MRAIDLFYLAKGIIRSITDTCTSIARVNLSSLQSQRFVKLPSARERTIPISLPVPAGLAAFSGRFSLLLRLALPTIEW